MGLQNALDLVLLELLRSGSARDFPDRHLAGGDRIGVVFIRIASRVGLEKRSWRSQPNVQQLCNQRAAVFFDGARDPGKALYLVIVPKSGEGSGRVDSILFDDLTAENDHSQPGLCPLFIVGNGLVGKNSLVRVPDPSGTNRTKNHPV